MSIVWLQDAAPSSRRDLGGKALSLGRLLRSGLPVPPGFVIPAGIFSEHARGLAAAGALTPEGLRETRLPPALRRDLAVASERLGSVLAVRSSGIAEDGAEASFAGQFDSIIGVAPGEALERAVQAVWSSALSDRVVAYTGSDDIPSLAVVVQQAVDAEAAGVLFTINPATGSWREMTVEAAHGLGEAVVSGRVVPDFYRVRRPRRTPRPVQRVLARLRLDVVSSTPGTQTRQWRADGEGTRECPLPEAQQGQLCLDRSTLRRLCRLGLRAEALLDGPQDVEWALADGTLWVLQSRPVTTVAALQRKGPVLWTRRFLGERWTEPATPLGWSEMRALLHWFVAYPETARRLLGGGEPTRLVRFAPYVNVTVFRHLAFKLPGSAPPGFLLELLPPDVAQSFVRRRAAPPDLPVYASILRETVRERRWQRFRWNPLLNWKAWDDFAPVLATSVQALSPVVDRRSAMERVRRCRVLARDYTSIHICSLLFANIWFEAAEASLAAAGHLDAVSLLLQPPSDSATALTNRALWRLGRGELSLEDFLEAYGHRAANSWELFSPRWCEEPHLPLSLAKTVAKAPDPGLRASERSEAVRARMATLPIGLRSLVRLARRYLLLRENQRFAFDRLLWSWKEALLWLEDDLGLPIRYLERSELDGLLQGRLPEPVARRLTEERSEAFAKEVQRRRQGDLPPEFLTDDEAWVAATAARRLMGQGISSGVATGPARVLRSLDDASRLQPGDILITSATDPSWTPLFHVAGAVVMELGGMLSHGAVVAREYGVPAVARASGATQQIPDGVVVTVDGGRGVVWIG